MGQLPGMGKRQMPLMGMPKVGAGQQQPSVWHYPPGTYTWTAPDADFYTFAGFGGGGSGGLASVSPTGSAAGGGSGSRTRIRKFISKGAQVVVIVGAGGSRNSISSGASAATTQQGSGGNPGGFTSFTFPDGTTAQANGGVAGSVNTSGAAIGGSGPSTAMGGDVNIPGASSAGASVAGASAGASLPDDIDALFTGPGSSGSPGGAGGSVVAVPSVTPGPGSGSGGTLHTGSSWYTVQTFQGGPGGAVVVRG